MRFRLNAVARVSLVVALTACAPAGEEPERAEEATYEADVEAIHRAHEEYRAAVNAGDLEGGLALVTDDVVWMPPNEPALTGKEAIRRWEGGEPLFERFIFEISFSPEEVVVFGDWAFERGTYVLTLTPRAGGEPGQGSGKYLWIWQRQPDGSWKNARAMWNSDNPPPGAQ